MPHSLPSSCPCRSLVYLQLARTVPRPRERPSRALQQASEQRLRERQATQRRRELSAADRSAEAAKADEAIQAIIAAADEKRANRARKAAETRPVATERSKSSRPTLSEQLASIADNASSITNDIRKTHGLDQPQDAGLLLRVPARKFAVGQLACRYPSPVAFYPDRCE